MANQIIWAPSEEQDIKSYQIDFSIVPTGTGSVLAIVPHDLTGSNYSPASGTFSYVDGDPFHTTATWYRISAIDQSDLTSLPSVWFQVAGSPVPSFQPGMTPFGIFDNDQEFQYDADKHYTFTRQKLGDPVMEVHLSASQAYAAFEEACLEYSAMVNSYQAKSVLTSFLGTQAALSGAENSFPAKNLNLAQQMSDGYAAEANVNSTLPVKQGYIDLSPGVQTYDLQSMLVSSGQLSASAGRIRMREIYHKSPLSAYRFFGTTSGINYLNSQFRFESYTPETLFYLLPIWEDVLRGMQFKTSNTVRRSNYSYAMHNNELTLYPAPADSRRLYFTYTVDTSASTPLIDPATQGSSVANLSNIPFGNIKYSQLNSLSKHWIRRMAHALAKEIEGQIRSKFSTVPIPNGDVTLNGPALVSDARSEQELLREELKELLEETTYQKLMEKETQMAQNLQETWKGVPMGIYVG